MYYIVYRKYFNKKFPLLLLLLLLLNELNREFKYSNFKHAALTLHFKGKPFSGTQLFVHISSMEISAILTISMDNSHQFLNHQR